MKKLLCLHGYGQNAVLFKKKISVLRNHLNKFDIECFFVDAPYICPQSSFDFIIPENGKAWYISSQDNSIYNGLSESLDYLRQIVDQNGEFIGVLGFSQGATMAALVASHLQCFRFLVCFGGFVPRSASAKLLLSFKNPSLHVIGRNDTYISPQESMGLASYLGSLGSQVEIINHDGGHVVPQTAEYRDQIVDFIIKQELANNTKL